MNKLSSLNIVILGLSITSSWGNGHATTYRGLIRELSKRGHKVLFLERDVPWYKQNRDLACPDFCSTELYSNLAELTTKYIFEISNADIVIVGSYVPQGVEVGEIVLNASKGITAFYDIDTPVTLAKLKRGNYEYVNPELISRYHLYLSFTGGPTLLQIKNEYGSPLAKAFYCSVDPELYFPEKKNIKWDLGYLGTYSKDRQPPLKKLLIDAAELNPSREFVVAGPQYPGDIYWPNNVERIHHLPPGLHCEFYNSQRFTLNITRADMIKAGYSPSVRLFEAAACGTPIISDYWEGIEEIFHIGSEILISESAEETLNYIQNVPEVERINIGKKAREKILRNHTAAHRAAELENYYNEVLASVKS